MQVEGKGISIDVANAIGYHTPLRDQTSGSHQIHSEDFICKVRNVYVAHETMLRFDVNSL